MLNLEILKNRGWVIEQESSGAYKLARDDYKMWYIPSNNNIAIYDKLINEDCQVIYRGKIVTIEQFDTISDLILRIYIKKNNVLEY
jgi:hypothetical protein